MHKVGKCRHSSVRHDIKVDENKLETALRVLSVEVVARK